MTSSSKSSRHWRHVGSKTAYQLHDYVDVDALEQLVSSSDGDITVQFYRRRNSARVSLDGVDVIVEDESEVRRRITTFVAETGMFSKALDRSTSRDRARLRLAGPRSLRSRERRCGLVPAVLAGSGTAEAARLALSEPTRISAVSPASSPVERWFSPARPARRCRPPRRSRPTIPLTLFTGPPRRSCNQVC